MASSSSSPAASRFASPPKKQCIDKAEACYVYYIQATYDDRRTINGELRIGLSFKRKVSEKFPAGKDLPFPDDQKLMEIEKEVIKGGRADGRRQARDRQDGQREEGHHLHRLLAVRRGACAVHHQPPLQEL